MLTIESISERPETVTADAIVQFLFEGESDLTEVLAEADRALGGTLRELLEGGEAGGKVHEVTVVHASARMPARRLLLLGAGKRADLTPERVSRLFGQAVREADTRRWRRLVAGTSSTNLERLDSAEVVRMAAMGAVIALARHDEYKTSGRSEPVLEQLLISNTYANNTMIAAGRAVGEGINLARDLVTQPPDDMTPEILARRAVEVGERHGFEIEVLDRTALERLGAGALLAVSRGSAREPRMVRLRYRGGTAGSTLGLVGKGITFDSGGLCIKTADGMMDMKIDMAGAAAVIGAMSAIGELKPAINVVAVCPICENVIGPSAFKPGDVVRTLSGKTIEVLNTDAEGRIVLADGLEYAQRSGATHLVDVATLTGACVVALGTVATGVMGGPQEWIDRILACASSVGERMWQLPLFEEYREQIDSSIADVENSGGRPAGAQTGALLLKEFVHDGVAWAHLDIAGTCTTDKGRPWMEKGATGAATRTMVRLAEMMASGS